MFSFMSQFLGKLFGTDAAASSLIDNISTGIDKLVYTDEEKSEDKAKALKVGNEVYMQWLQSTSGSRVARRFIALVVTIVWAMQYVLSLLLATVAPWVSDPDTLEAMMKSSEALSQNGEQGNAAFMIILGFYFLGSKADGLIQAAVGKFVKK